MNCFNHYQSYKKCLACCVMQQMYDLSSHVVCGLGVGTGRAAAMSARRSNVHMIMEKNFKNLIKPNIQGVNWKLS